jgi:DNA-binding CsgD family transcriptional regulator
VFPVAGHEPVDKEPDFDMVIQRHLTRAHKLRAIQQMIAEDQGIIPDLLEILTNAAGAPADPAPARTPPDARRRVDAKTQADKIVAYFTANGNTMASIRQIADGTGLTRNTVNALLYNSSQKELFKSLRVGPKRKLWRLREGENDQDDEMDLEQLQELGLDESDIGDDDSDEPEA